MLKSICTAGLSAACFAATAQSSVTVGGTLDLGLRQVRNGSVGSQKSEVSGANATSKLIIRGVEDLGGGLSAGFYLDGTILADTGVAGAAAPAGQFWDRRSTVSVASAQLGEVRLGRDWVPTHLVWTGFDPFMTLGIASANTFRSFAASRALGQAFGTAGEATTANPTLRVSNALEYFLPAGLAGIYGQAIVTAGEGGTPAAGGTRGEGFRLGWAGSGWNVAAAQFTTHNAAGDQSFKDQVYGASYDFGVVKLDVAQRRWLFGVDRTVNTQFGAVIPVGRGVIKLTYLRANQTGATAAQSAKDASLLGAGYVYSLSKRTALYAHVAQVENKGAATFAIPGGPAVSGTATAANYFGGQKSTAYEVGVRHDF
ncbi:porin [Ideonella azotifigens]|uniref:Porin n=1 Tax=Ideonella azotifigens TaxID=513160 RepID=A0ABN1JV82_9BURK|nr:porin [Ideonella azotifigens]MCD2341132.1 porin [Ideonella azotifigens]